MRCTAARSADSAARTVDLANRSNAHNNVNNNIAAELVFAHFGES